MSDLGRYRKVYARLWRHPGFLALTDAEKTLVFYLLTGPQTNRLGLYVLSVATAAEDLGTVPQTLSKRLVTVCETFGWLVDAKARVLFIPSWFRWNPPDNNNVMKGSLRDLNEIPPCGLVDAFARNIETVPETVRETFFEGLRQRLSNGMGTQEQYQKQKQNQDQKPIALRASTEGKAGGNVRGSDERLLPIARTVLEELGPAADIQTLLDHFFYECRARRVDVPKRAEAIEVFSACGVAA